MPHIELGLNLEVETSYFYLADEVDSKLKLCVLFYCNYCIGVVLLSNYICQACVLRFHNGDRAYS